MYTVYIHLLYLAISLPVALLVSWTLHKNGRVFLVEVFQGKEDLADSVNHLLVVGAYLVSIGFVTLAIKIGATTTVQEMGGMIELVSMKVGLVLLVLGGGHFANLLFLSRLRWRMRLVAPQGLENLTRPAQPQEHPSGASEPGLHDYHR